MFAAAAAASPHYFSVNSALPSSHTTQRLNQYSLLFCVCFVVYHYYITFVFFFVQFSSVTRSCPTLCNPMDCSMPGFRVLHYLLEFVQTRVHWVGDALQPSHPLSPRFSSCLQSFPAARSFPRSLFFTSGGQSTGVSASASVLPVNIQGWSPLGLTGLISLQSKGLSGVFSSTTMQKHQFFCCL